MDDPAQILFVLNGVLSLVIKVRKLLKPKLQELSKSRLDAEI